MDGVDLTIAQRFNAGNLNPKLKNGGVKFFANVVAGFGDPSRATLKDRHHRCRLQLAVVISLL